MLLKGKELGIKRSNKSSEKNKACRYLALARKVWNMLQEVHHSTKL
jgi:hypothetical protein